MKQICGFRLIPDVSWVSWHWIKAVLQMTSSFCNCTSLIYYECQQTVVEPESVTFISTTKHHQRHQSYFSRIETLLKLSNTWYCPFSFFTIISVLVAVILEYIALSTNWNKYKTLIHMLYYISSNINACVLHFSLVNLYISIKVWS